MSILQIKLLECHERVQNMLLGHKIFFLFMDTPLTYGRFQARGQIELHLQHIPHLEATLVP